MQIERDQAEADYKAEWASDGQKNPSQTADWFQQEAGRIREAAETEVPAAELGLATAYWNGRRESFNSAREDVLANYPDRANDLPDAIQVDEIQIRQKALQQEQDRSLVTAR